ncbi:MAG: competence/damage-inducible protein A [Acidobacteria bacterium]|nr:competence/damage-inducible protein A [Acidobacteriota bacterium]
MNAEIIAVGSEMLTPDKIDTNSLYLTQELNTLGIEVVAKSIIGDDRAKLTAAIAAALASSELVILTGGLGPTEDDVTRDAAAAALGVGQHYDESVWHRIEERFKKFNRTPSANNRRQADILNGAEVLPNPNGTAPGQWFSRSGKILVMLPGPPRELKPMVASEIVPKLSQILPPMAIRARWYRVALMGESDLDSLIAPVYTKYANPVTTILAAAGDIDIHLRARSVNAEEAETLLEELGSHIESLIGDRIYSNNGDSLSKTVGDMLRAHGQTVAVAESCTGGLLGATITEVSGSSKYFAGGFLTYTNEMKTALLDVPPALIEKHTEVSEEVSIAMASGARAKTNATYALSVTGYADGDRAGLVYIGLATPKHTHARRLSLFGDRQRVRGLAVINCLDWLRRSIAPELR